jgi:iduronate 2-sulfatase
MTFRFLLFPLLFPFYSFSQGSKPNVLFIAVDDLRPELGCYGHNEVKSPTIDAIANAGGVFTKAYCQNALCGPSRASLMSGSYPDKIKVYGMSASAKTNWDNSRPSFITLPEQFRNYGYNAVGFGKIYDQRLGNDEGSSWDAFTQRWKGEYISPRAKAILKTADSLIALGMEPDIIRPAVDFYDTPDETYTDGSNAKLAVEFINNYNSSEPFFLALGFSKPHLPFVAPKKYWDMYDRNSISLPEFTSVPINSNPEYTFTSYAEIESFINKSIINEDKIKELRHGYFACISYIDAQLAKVLKALEDKGELDNTIIVFWGDHGFKLGDYDRWAKMTNLDIDARAPLIIKLPEGQNTPLVCNSPVDFVDVLPTICEAAGLPVPASAQGTSLMPILKGKAEAVREYAFFQSSDTDYSIRTDRWHYTEYRKKNTTTVECRELYDLGNGTIQRENVIVQNPTVVAELAVTLQAAIDRGKGNLTAPSAPANLAATNITQNACELSWELSGTAMSYDIYKNGIYYNTVINNNIQIDNLSPGTEYSFTVKQRNKHGMLSDPGNLVSVTTKISTGINNISTNTENEIVVYPNPVNEVAYLKNDFDGHLQIVTTEGRLVCNSYHIKGDLLDFAATKTGMYILKLTDNSKNILTTVFRKY